MENDSTILLVTAKNNPGINDKLLAEFNLKLKDFLNSLKHYYLLPSDESRQFDENCPLDEACLDGLKKKCKADKVLLTKLTRSGSLSIIISFKLFNFNTTSSANSLKSVEKLIKQQKVYSGGLFQEVIEELFFPENIFEIKGFLKIASNEEDTLIFLDGKLLDYTLNNSGILSLLPGTYAVEAKKQDFLPVKKKISIESGKLSSLNFELEKNRFADGTKFPEPEKNIETASSKNNPQISDHSNTLLWSLSSSIITGIVTAAILIYANPLDNKEQNRSFHFYKQ